ncbi:MAG: dihydrofolate reductase family protein [Thermoleophilia bacterium]|nr:dihydrofolate reductase family protein [Thermoleophilia bacterium]
MRRLIVCNMVSMDGYYEGPGRDVMALFEYRSRAYPADESFDAYNAERLRAADTLLVGRTMYDQIKGYWPALADDPDAPPVEREVSRLLNAMEKMVVSDSLTPEETEPWRDSTRVLKRPDVYEQVAGLKHQTGRDILMLGSRTVWNDLLHHGLIDELHLMISPVVLGAGTPVFDGKPPAAFRLMDARTWKGSGIVLLRYELLYGKT